MRVRSIAPALLLSVLLPAGLQAQNEDLARLIPADTVAIVRISSLETIEKRMVEVGGYFGEKEEAQSMFDEMVSDMASFSDVIDRKKPLAIAMQTDPEGMGLPGVAMVIPVTDTVAASEKEPGLRISGSYVLKGMEGEVEPASEPTSLLNDLPQGDVVLRVNLEPITEQYLPMLEMMVPMMVSEMENEGMEGVDPEEIGDMVLDGVTAFAESAGMLDLAFGMKDGFISMSGNIGMRPGTPFFKRSQQCLDRVTPLARALPKGGFMAVAQDTDFSGLGGFYDGMWEEVRSELKREVPEEFRKDAAQALDLLIEFQQMMLKGRASMGMKFTPRGIEASGAWRSKTPGKLLDLMSRMAKLELMDKVGLDASMKETGKLGESAIHEFRIGVTDKLFDLLETEEEKRPKAREALGRFLGSEGLRIQLTTVPDHLVGVFNPAEDTLKSLVGRMANEQATVPARIAKLIRRAGKEPKMVMTMDVGRMMREMGAVASEIAPEPNMPEFDKLPDARIDAWAGVSPGTWAFGLGVDLRGIAEFAMIMDR